MNLDEREKELWREEGEIAIRLIEWFDLFIKIRTAADRLPADVIVGQLRRADPDAMDGAFIWLLKLLQDRFRQEQTTLRKLRKLESVRPAFRSKYADDVKRRVIAASEKVSQKEIERTYGVKPRTLRDWKKKKRQR